MRRVFSALLTAMMVAAILVPAIAPLALPAEAIAAQTVNVPPDAGNNGSTSWYVAPFVAALDKVVQTFFSLVGTIVLNILSLVLWMVGSLLDMLVTFSIVEMSTKVNSIITINIAWAVFRDLANMTFIFVILYLAFQLILGTAGGSAWRSLAWLILMALLINFSLFFTKVVIDVSNILAIGFYEGITQGNGGTGITATFMNQLGLPTIFDAKTDAIIQLFANPQMTGTNVLVYMLGGSLFILVTIFVFLALGVLLLIRFVYLIFLMMFSPLAFAAYVLPGTKGYFNQWWSKLINQAFFAPAVMALLWVSFQILSGVNQSIGAANGGSIGTISGYLAQEKTSIGAAFTFALSIFMMVYSIILAQKFGAVGAATINKWGKAARLKAQAYAGRELIAKPLRSTVLENQRVKDWAAKSTLGQTMYGATSKVVDSGFGAGSKQNLKNVEEAKVKSRAGYVDWLNKKPSTAPVRGGSFGETPPTLPVTERHLEGRELREYKETRDVSTGHKERIAEIEEKLKAEREELGRLRPDEPDYPGSKYRVETLEKELAQSKQALSETEKRTADLEQVAAGRERVRFLSPQQKTMHGAQVAERQAAEQAMREAADNKQFKDDTARLEEIKRRRQGLTVGTTLYEESLREEEALKPQIAAAQARVDAAKARVDAANKLIQELEQQSESIRREFSPTDEERIGDRMDDYKYRESLRGGEQRARTAEALKKYEEERKKKDKKKQGGGKKKEEGRAEEKKEESSVDTDDLEERLEKLEEKAKESES